MTPPHRDAPCTGQRLDKRDPRTGRVRTWVKDGCRYIQLTHGTRDQIGDEQPTRQREHRNPRVAIGRIRDNPAGRLPHALTPSALLNRELLTVGATELLGIDHDPLMARRHIELP